MKIENGLKIEVLFIKISRMATPHSVDSNDVQKASLGEHITNISKSIDTCIKLTKLIYEARGRGDLKSGKKLTLADGKEMGLDDLNSFVSEVKNNIKNIPKIVNSERKAELERKRARHAKTVKKAQPPSRCSEELVMFFKNADLGTTKDGSRRLQDHPDMSLFFNNGVGNLPFGVSLFNVWGNIYKMKHKSVDIVLDASAQRALSSALAVIRKKKNDIINSPDLLSSDPYVKAAAEKAAATAKVDLEFLDANKIRNKDYMNIWSHYTKPNTPEDVKTLTPYAESVNNMSAITKDLNKMYRKDIETTRDASAKATAAPAISSALPSLKVQASLPVTTVSARGSSPVTRRR
jgi:hypothetical protein